MIGGYVGQTALKTEKKINKSLGGVLFIDEAYALFSDGGEDYGYEAIATLVKAMEDKRDKFICIMAGYTDEMNLMINMNPGLRDRVQFYIDFPDYSVNELMQIFMKFCKEKKYTLSSSAKDTLHDALSQFTGAKRDNFSNGRLVRKLFERICIKQAQRTDGFTIVDSDIAAVLEEPEFASMIKKAIATIGFSAS